MLWSIPLFFKQNIYSSDIYISSLQLSCLSTTNTLATTCNRVAWFSLGSSTSVDFFAQGQAFGYSPIVIDTSDAPDGCAATSQGAYSSFSNFQFAIYNPGDASTSIWGPGIHYATPDQAKNVSIGVDQLVYDGSGDSTISTDPFYALWVDLGYAGSESNSSDYWFYNNIGVTMTITGCCNPTALTFLGWSEAGSGYYPTNYTLS